MHSMRGTAPAGITAKCVKAFLLGAIATPIVWTVFFTILFSLGGIGRLSSGWTFQHWKSAFAEPLAFRSLAFSFLISCIVLSTLMVLTLLPLLIRPTLRNSRVIAIVGIAIMSTPSLVIAQLFSSFFSSGGLLSRLAFRMGLIHAPNEFPAFTNDPWNLGMTISITITFFPLVWFYHSQLWTSARMDRYYQLAISLGASPWQARTKVALPILLRKSRGLWTLIFILIMGSFEIPLLLGRQNPQMISVATQQLVTKFDMSTKPQAFVLATLYLLCVSLLLVLYIQGRRSDAFREN